MSWTAFVDTMFDRLHKREVPEPQIEFAAVQDDAAARAWLDQQAVEAGRKWDGWARLREVNSGWRGEAE